MPHEPKRRHSTERKGKRRASITLATKKTILCPNCNSATLSHRVCKNCGFYKGVRVLKTKRSASVK